ncbi:SAM-dependent methyltransferase [Streptosporangium sp. KLBMP 9127]|nr:SAM-dependent methyltransferase [Streptosporangium sp. KLBMP 9127]
MQHNEPSLTEGTIDLTKPNVARVYDYLLGGKDHFAVDRAAGDQIRKAMPGVQIGVEEQRAVLRRATRYLVGEAGLRQLLDIGTGLPTVNNVHDVAHSVDPGVRVTYVDNDPIVLSHARALLANDTATVVVGGDLRRPEELLDRAQLMDNLDLREPLGLILCGILHHIPDDDDPWAIVGELVAALPPGSHVFIQHLVDPGGSLSEELRGLGRGRYRHRDEIARFFTGLEMVEPGLVHVTDWRPDPDTPSLDYDPALLFAVAGLARKPA